MVAVSWSGWLDARGAAHLDASFQRALVSFALARTLNGVISVVQETQIALQPAGVGVTLMPGEILDPLNDLVERFSLVMLSSSAALGIERVLLTMSGWWALNAALAVAAVLWLAAAWLGGARPRWQRVAWRVLLGMTFLRFAVPVLLIATHLISATFLDAKAQEASDALRVTSEQARALGDQADAAAKPEEEGSALDRLAAMGKSLDLERRARELRENLTHAVEHIIDLIVVFMLETVLFPLAFLWLLGRLFGLLVEGAWARSLSPGEAR
jgi:hypothetical protein